MRSTLPALNEVWQRQSWAGILKQTESFSENTTFLIGCSGGMDSMLLLHLMSYFPSEKIRAIYVDHQLQSSSADWGQFVVQQCQALNISCVVEQVTVTAGNLEKQAREARYQAYLKHLKPTDLLVLAHHEQDQAETLMLRLLSGSGVFGLSAMQQLDIRTDIRIWRPLLNMSREQICQWAQQLNVQNIEDPTNQDTHYDRAWSREILWPLLNTRFPRMQQALGRTALLMQDAAEILTEVLEQDLQQCGNSSELKIAELSALSIARQRQLLSAWMKGTEQYRPSMDMVERVIREVLYSKKDAQAALHWNGFYYVRYQQMLYRLTEQEYTAGKNPDTSEDVLYIRALNQSVQTLAGSFVTGTAETGLSLNLLNQPLKLTGRQGGEKIHLHGRVGSWPLKKAVQEAQIFPWMRHTIQILSVDNVMLGVFTPKGFWLAHSAYCEKGGWQPYLVSQYKERNDGRES
ncbi:tRNA lysidine(34) synthetase TilS [Acinetobacter chinensis]|uniref:tRNA(Ile)-lysidine synthase n=1 Tax=Acinetobacter chinensis TaxID=2004650 RepID=A0ABU3WIW9_9GAMM|nr:tRNA lysidine(34) synthetase TilS [Acinetobacter chinensis]MDV2470345.1 tRNA lysidine(34) synthetase TilS [Acinetobacter chinensis]